jgi:hypothetical protein
MCSDWDQRLVAPIALPAPLPERDEVDEVITGREE